MTLHNASTSTTAYRRFDFGEPIFVLAIQMGGKVAGIRVEGDSWLYAIPGSDDWWAEHQLEVACPQCLNAWDEKGTCPHCGFAYDD